MSKTPDEMKKRRVILADGRYLIFYTFEPLPVAASSEIVSATKKTIAENARRGKLSV